MEEKRVMSMTEQTGRQIKGRETRRITTIMRSDKRENGVERIKRIRKLEI